MKRDPVAPDDPRLSYEIRLLELTARGMRACRQLHVRTVGDFLQRDRSDFLRLRNCGDKTFDDIAHSVRDFLSAPTRTERAATGPDLDRTLHSLIDNSRALRAFQALSISTVGEFLDTPKDELLAVPGFGERTYWLVTQRISQVAGPEEDPLDLLPHALLEYSLDDLVLHQSVLRDVRAIELCTVGALLRCARPKLHRALGAAGLQEIRESLGELIGRGTDRHEDVAAHAEVDFVGSMRAVLSLLGYDERTVLTQRIGLAERVRSITSIADHLEISPAMVRVVEEQVRTKLRDIAPSFVQQLHDEARREYRNHDGFIHANKLTPDTFLHGAAVSTGDAMVALRMLRFLFAGEFYLYGPLLTTVHPAAFHALIGEVKRNCRREQLPMPVRQLKTRVQEVIDPAPAGLLMHLAMTHGQVRVQLDPTLGEVLKRDGQSIADQLAEILAEDERPRTLEDIFFIYRDLHRVGNMQVLLDHMRKDKRFLEVGRAMWNLRTHHEDELSLIQPIAEEIIDAMLQTRERRNMLDPEANADIPERRIYLLIACMRNDTRLRYLGRGLFCVPGQTPPVMADIRDSMKRAMGEIVISRFLDNQPRDRRQMAQVLLRHNRALIETNPDRVDTLTNYPFNEERLTRLFQMIDEELERGRGYASAEELLEVVCATDLGGNWLSEHMLLDLLRRHTDFELLPGAIIAQPDLGLAGWIQQRIRECLRDVGGPLTRDQVLSETPDLAAFEECLDELIHRDPMVQSEDGVHHTLV